jgi:hypothetical protein
MKRLLFTLNISVFFLLVFTSCCKDDTYIALTTEAKELLLYEVGDTFQLRNTTTDEVITLIVNSKEIDFYKDTNPGWWGGSYGGDLYLENGNYNFSDDTNCYQGSISVEARSNGKFEFTAYIGQCFGNINNSFEYQDEFLPSEDVGGVQYTNVYLIKSFNQTIFYSKEKGIIKIVKNSSQEMQFVIVE